MGFVKTDIDGVLIYEPKVFSDDRGYFFESYNKKTLLEIGIDLDLVQDNQSFSSYGVLRGLHFQKEPYAQAKIVRALKGRILDIVVDIRKDSPTYKKWISVELSDDNFKQLIIPKGFAHGLAVLSETALVMYKCDDFYSPKADAGIRFDDPELNIDWKIDKKRIKVSEKDAKLPFLKDIN